MAPTRLEGDGVGSQEQASIQPPGARVGFCRRHRGVLAVALVAVLGFYVRSWEGDLHGDPVHYGAVARTMAATGNWLDPHDAPGVFYARKPPLMFWLVALDFKLFGVSTYGAKFWSCAFAVGVCLLTYLVGRRLFGETAGVLAGVMVATFPGVVPNAIDLRLDSAVSFFTVLAVYGALRAAQDERPRWLLLPGLAAGLGMMVKPSAAMHVAVLSAVTLAVWRPRLLVHPYVAGAAGLAAAVAAPWHLAMVARHGRQFTDTYFGEQIGSRVAPGGYFFRNLAGYLGAMAARALPWWPLGAYALARRSRAGRFEQRGMTLAVLWLVAILVLMAVPPLVYNRYMVPAYPAVALLAGRGLSSLLSRRARALVPAVAAVYALTVTCVLATVPFGIHTNASHGFQLAQEVLDRLEPGTTVAAYRPDEPPGPALLPDQWGLRARCVFYLGRNYRNYKDPRQAAVREQFIICQDDKRPALEAVGFRAYLSLSDRYWLMGRPPAAPAGG